MKITSYDKLRPWNDIERCICESVSQLVLVDILTDNPIHCFTCKNEIDAETIDLPESLVDEIALLHQGQLLIEGSLANVRKKLGLEENSGIVEMICSATGIDPEDISLELSRDNMLPFKSLGGEEE